jgi:predicted glycogen debranching enzyme
VNDRHAREIRAHGQGSPRVEPALGGLKIQVEEGGQPLWLLAPRAEFHVNSTWHHGHRLERESEQGLADLEDHLCAGEIHTDLESGESLMVVASTRRDVGLSEAAPLALAGALARRRAHERSLLETWKRSHPGAARVAPDWIHHLVLAADSFIVERPTMGDPSGRLILSGYPGSGNRARDAMIALSGLTLVTGRSEVARAILETYARRLDQGMLPSGSAEPDGATDYDTVDASLWFFQALRAYHDATADDAFLARMYPVLEDIGAWYERGTRFGIRVDEDMLVTQGAYGSSLTWMDARAEDHAVSPRHGKTVEVNALWYNALAAMTVFARRLKRPTENYDAMAERVARGFARFWNAETGHLFDIVDGPEGNDPTLRPNQILAVSLPDSPLTAAQRRAVVDACGRQLVTSYGLRTLAPDDSRYRGTCTGDPNAQAVTLHHGAVWSWLLPHFALAYARARGDRETALGFLEPLGQRVGVFGVGWLPEMADGEAPHASRGAIAHACTVAETLRVWHELALEKRRVRRRVPARTAIAETADVS